jgi:hypothetical protein
MLPVPNGIRPRPSGPYSCRPEIFPESSRAEYHLELMARQDLLQVRFRRRGNPNWGSGAMAPLPILPTEFEMQARRLHLRPEDYVGSAELRDWCKQSKNRCYP